MTRGYEFSCKRGSGRLERVERELENTTYVSAKTIRVREAFSIVNFVLPS